MQHIETTSRNFNELSRMGINLAIDDFGTGYSSLSHLRKLPIRKLKIDKSFVVGVADDPDSKAIATAIVAMAHSMKLIVVAEGVETEEQREILTSLGCDEIQGYVIRKPLPTEAFEELIAA
jgi:diguanylate cyclase